VCVGMVCVRAHVSVWCVVCLWCVYGVCMHAFVWCARMCMVCVHAPARVYGVCVCVHV